MGSKNIKNIPRRVNLDDDIRVMENTDLRSARNIRIMSSFGSESGSVENIPSNASVTIPNKPIGTNTAIGSIKHEERNDLYVFFHNSNDSHFIVRYNSITDKARIVLTNTLLKFSKEAFVSGFAVTGNNVNETLLYWTDTGNINQPRKINVKRAERHTDGDYTNGYPNPLTEEYIRWVKYPPLERPSISHKRDTSVSKNNIGDKIFKFRYRYYYKDGEYSALSPISITSNSDLQLKNGINGQEKFDDFFNYIEIEFKNSWSDVDKIEVLYSKDNGSVWSIIKIVDNIPSSPTQTFDFYNDGVYIPIINDDQLKNYDAVPLFAKTVEYAANRSLLANTVDGFDSISDTELDSKLTFNARYDGAGAYNTSDITLTIPSFTTTTVDVNVDTSVLTLLGGNIVTINFSIEMTIGTFVFVEHFYAKYNLNSSDTYSTLITELGDQLFGQGGNFLVCSGYSNSSNDLRLVFTLTQISSGTPSFLLSKNISTYDDVKDAKSSLKRGSDHPYGVVYFDEANRSCSVQSGNQCSPFVKWLSDVGEDNRRGSVSADWRIGIKPPIWAKHFRIVYGGNSSIGDFTQFSISRSYTTNNIDSKGVIYLPISPLKGNEKYSYNDSRGALTDYTFKEGDRMRVISYIPYTESGVEANRRFIEEYREYKVVGLDYLEASSENPIYNASDINSFGWMLIVEAKQTDIVPSGWGYVQSSSNNSNWGKPSNGNPLVGHGALIEVYSPKDVFIDKNIYYEVGDKFDIIDAGTSDRRHSGERNQGESVSHTIGSFGTSDGYGDYVAVVSSELKLYIGDVVSFSGGTPPSGTHVISDIVYDESNDNWKIYFSEQITGLTDATTINLDSNNLYAGGNTSDGDVWYKPREVYTGIRSNGRSFNSFISFIEDYSSNDFFKSNFYNNGRVHLYSEYAKQEGRKATIWISEQFFPDTKTNGMSSFNLSAADMPFKDYDRSLGGITLIKRHGDAILLFQENKTSQILVGKETLKTGDGGDLIVLSGSVLGEANPYMGDYGICLNPESHAEANGRHYFVDIKRGKVLRISQDGFTPISDYKFSSLLDQLSRDYMEVINSSNLKIYGGYDKEFDEYVITFEEINTFTLTIDAAPIGFSSAKVSQDDNYISITVPFASAKNVKKIVDEELFPAYELGLTSVDLIDVTTNGLITFTSDDVQELEENTLLDIALEIDGEIYEAGYRLSNNELVIGKTNAGAGGVTFGVGTTPVKTVQPITIAFHEGSNSWIGNRDHISQGYATINYKFFSFNNGLWKHNIGEDYNTFYGTSYQSVLAPVIKDNPSYITVLNSISLEGNLPMDVFVDTRNMSTEFDSARFDKREFNFYADIPKATATTNSKNSNVLGVGILESGTTTGKTFTTPLAGLNITVGDLLYNNTSTVNLGVITAVDYETNTITHTTSGSGVDGVDFFYIVKSSKSEGEPIRGYSFIVTLTQPSAYLGDYFELFSINGNVTKSNLTLD